MFVPDDRFLRLLAYALTKLFWLRARLEAEILILRHQLNVLRRKAPKQGAFVSIDRLVFDRGSLTLFADLQIGVL
jgi:hypothetical protein